jgi:hypothetical protein
MRTHKIATIILYQADASAKQEDPDERVRENILPPDEEGCSRIKCCVWFHLTQELLGIFWISFLLLICLPVLAFWSMFIGIIISSCNMYMLIKRLWKDAHSRTISVVDEDEIIDDSEASEKGEDIEFQEFLSNYSNEEVEREVLVADDDKE